jgi:hypothetical protein
MNIEQEDNSETQTFGDSDFLAMNDKAIQNFRENENDAKRKIVKKMLTLRHNMKYNKHLLSVYMKAKALFDKMVDEHRSQLHSLDEIYRHLNHLIRENMSKNRIDSKNSVSSNMMTELIKDKKQIGLLLKKMRNSYDKLMNIDTILGMTVDKVNEITFMDDDNEDNDRIVEVNDDDDDGGEDYDDEEGEGEDVEDVDDGEGEDDEDDEGDKGDKGENNEDESDDDEDDDEDDEDDDEDDEYDHEDDEDDEDDEDEGVEEVEDDEDDEDDEDEGVEEDEDESEEDEGSEDSEGGEDSEKGDEYNREIIYQF